MKYKSTTSRSSSSKKIDVGPPRGNVFVALTIGDYDEIVVTGGSVRVVGDRILQINVSNGPPIEYVKTDWVMAVWRSRSNTVRTFVNRYQC